MNIAGNTEPRTEASLHTPRYINTFGEFLPSYLETNFLVLKGEIKTCSFFFFFDKFYKQTFPIWMNKTKLTCHLHSPWHPGRNERVYGLRLSQCPCCWHVQHHRGGKAGRNCLWSLKIFGRESIWSNQKVSAGLRAEHGSSLLLQSALDETTFWGLLPCTQCY